MKRVLVTGGAGFIAHHTISEILRRTDWEIVSLDRLDYSGNLNRLHDILSDLTDAQRKRFRVVYHDLKAELNPMITADIGRIDYVIHMAAGSHVDRSIDHPMEFVMDNVVGTCNLLNYARQLDSLERLIYFSTDEVFGPVSECKSKFKIIKPLLDFLFEEGNPSGIKAALSFLNLCQNNLRLPLIPVSNQLKTNIQNSISKIKKDY